MGHILLAKEIARRVTARDRIERDAPRSTVAHRARFIETDVAAAADAENLKVDAAGAANQLLITRAVIVDLAARDGAVGNVDILRLDIDVLEKRLPHPATIAVRVLGRHGIILVKVERDD